jgi:hypothetical protein
MEMLVIAVVALIAFAVVLVPLFRRGTRSPADAREFDDGTPAPPAKKRRTDAAGRKAPRASRAAQDTVPPQAPLAPPQADPVRGEGVVPPMAAGPATPVAPPGATAPDAPAEPTVPDATAGASRRPAGKNSLEREVARYREAVRAGTVCGRCGEANPPGSRFCGECGNALGGGEDSSEFA